MKTPLFVGSSVAIITPFKDGQVDYDRLGKQIDFQIAGGTAALTVCGTTGECATQDVEEHSKVVEFCVRYAAGRIKIIAGSGSNDTNTALYLARRAKESGADGILMVTPYYNKTSQQGLVKHFTYVADRVDIPMVLYNVPSRTTLSCTAETYYELSKHPNINGVKEASADCALVARTLALCGDDLHIWSGEDSFTLAAMALGAKGTISVIGNILPKFVSDLCRLCLDGNFTEARALNIRYSELTSAMFYEVNPVPVKTAMRLLGRDSGELRLPLCEMYPANLERLKGAMRAAGLAINE